MALMTEVWTSIGIVAATLFGIWRMLAHYETRNDAAHADLGCRIDGVNSRIDNLFGRVGT